MGRFIAFIRSLFGRNDVRLVGYQSDYIEDLMRQAIMIKSKFANRDKALEKEAYKRLTYKERKTYESLK